jgi:hypothetical protein
MATDVPNTKLYNFVDTPVSVTYSQFGEVQVPLEADPIIDVTGFRQVSFLIGRTKAASWTLSMGKISGSTLAAGNDGPIDSSIHTFDVVGPEIVLVLKGGKPKTKDKLELWVYLRS